jgi:hypothetical protein
MASIRDGGVIRGTPAVSRRRWRSVPRAPDVCFSGAPLETSSRAPPPGSAPRRTEPRPENKSFRKPAQGEEGPGWREEARQQWMAVARVSVRVHHRYRVVTDASHSSARCSGPHTKRLFGPDSVPTRTVSNPHALRTACKRPAGPTSVAYKEMSCQSKRLHLLHVSASSKALASRQSAVSTPSVNQP